MPFPGMPFGPFQTPGLPKSAGEDTPGTLCWARDNPVFGDSRRHFLGHSGEKGTRDPCSWSAGLHHARRKSVSQVLFRRGTI